MKTNEKKCVCGCETGEVKEEYLFLCANIPWKTSLFLVGQASAYLSHNDDYQPLLPHCALLETEPLSTRDEVAPLNILDGVIANGSALRYPSIWTFALEEGNFDGLNSLQSVLNQSSF